MQMPGGIKTKTPAVITGTHPKMIRVENKKLGVFRQRQLNVCFLPRVLTSYFSFMAYPQPRRLGADSNVVVFGSFRLSECLFFSLADQAVVTVRPVPPNKSILLLVCLPEPPIHWFYN